MGKKYIKKFLIIIKSGFFAPLRMTASHTCHSEGVKRLKNLVFQIPVILVFANFIYPTQSFDLFSKRLWDRFSPFIFRKKITPNIYLDDKDKKNRVGDNKEKQTLKKQPDINKKVISKKILIENVPFFVQAPFSNWKIHRESCEEASALMIHNYLSGYNNMDMKIIDITLREMKKFQQERYGEEKDLYNNDYIDFIKDFFKYRKVNLITNATLLDIKIKLFKGIPVIVPVRANILANPHYTHAGYHVLVAIGYDDYEKQIIANDPGTIQGKMFSYPYSKFESAMLNVGSSIITIEDVVIKTVQKS